MNIPKVGDTIQRIVDGKRYTVKEVHLRENEFGDEVVWYLTLSANGDSPISLHGHFLADFEIVPPVPTSPVVGRRYRHKNQSGVIAIIVEVDATAVRIYWEGTDRDQDSFLFPLGRFHEFTPVGVTPRPTAAQNFMKVAHVVSERGTCDRRQVGAVAVREGRILATGYNGAPPGCPHCTDVGHDLITINGRESCSRAIHAEANLISYAARFGVSIEGATVYCNTYPCHNCFKQMVSAGIAEVVYDSDYCNDALVEKLWREANVKLTKFA